MLSLFTKFGCICCKTFESLTPSTAEFIKGTEEGSDVCKALLTSATFDIHQLLKRWQQISSHWAPPDPELGKPDPF